MTTIRKQKRRGFGWFGLAATLYTAGVIAYSAWSYIKQRDNLLLQVDLSLIHATYATEQILGDIYLECAVETETTFAPGYERTQRNLNRFARDCGFDLIGAVARKNDRLWELIAGGQSANVEDAASCRRQFFESGLSPFIHRMAEEGTGSIRMETLTTGSCGELRVALRYKTLSKDAGYTIVVAASTDTLNQLISRLALRSVGIGAFLYAMAFPLIVLYHRVQTRLTREAAELHDMLQDDYVKLKERETELEDAIHDLERFNSVAIGRETRIIELKGEVNALLEQMGQQKRYNVE